MLAAMQNRKLDAVPTSTDEDIVDNFLDETDMQQIGFRYTT
jgi:hypothetical protein